MAGFALLLSATMGSRHTARDGEGSDPERLPYDSGLSVERGKATLVMVLDAGSPAADVSLGELRRTIAGREASLVAHVVFVVRDGQFVARELWGEAASIPGVHVLRDAGGVEAARLAAAPGTTVIYAADRRLLFRGGGALELPSLPDRPTTDTGAPARRKDAAHRRPGPLEDWVDPADSYTTTL